MRTVRQLLEAKPAEIIAIGPDAPVIDAIRLMAERGIGAVLVMDGPRLVGILSERDYARKVVLMGRASTTTRVREIMTSTVVTATPGQSVDDAMRLMTTHRIRHLPVARDGRVLGIVSIGDLVKSVIEDQRHVIEDLQHYIAG